MKILRLLNGPRLAKVLGGGAALYVCVCCYFWLTQDEKIFKPLAEIVSDPGRLGIEYERVRIDVGEGEQKSELDAFWVPVVDADAPVVLYLHGQDANIGKNLVHTQNLHQCGCNVLVIDYRGFGDSFGKFSPSESSVYEDAEAAWNYLIVDLGFEASQIFIFGHSLGASIAVELATRQSEAGGLIVESGFTSVAEIAQWKMPVTSLLPLSLLLNHRFSSIEKIGRIEIPKLIIHGSRDEKVPFWMSEKLHAAACEPKAPLLRIDGGGHADCCLVGLVEHQKALKCFVFDTLKE